MSDLKKESDLKSVKTKTLMAEEYGVCFKTFDRMLKSKGIFISRRLITPKEQELIYNLLGFPKVLKNSNKFN